jgi:3',5'-cyclic AMP phosphodiesterase CpdA
MPVVVQLSDFHLGDDEEASARLDAVLAHVAAMAVRPDALLVTGDVLDAPDRAGDYAAVGRRLAALGVPVIACPGNHDDRVRFRSLLAGDPAEGPVDTRLDLDGLTILACDTSVAGQPWGRLEAATLAWLERELAGASGPVLVALHHTPVPIGMPIIDAIALRRPEGLEQVLRAAPNVIGVVSGHAHTTAATTFAGLPLLVCPAVSSTILLEQEGGATPVFDRSAPPALAIHLVEGARLTSHVRVVGPLAHGTLSM